MDITGFNEQIGEKPPIVKLYNYIKAKVKEKQAPKPVIITVKPTSNTGQQTNKMVMPKVNVPVKSAVPNVVPMPKVNVPVFQAKPSGSTPIKVAVMPKSAIPITKSQMPKIVVMPKNAIPKNAPIKVKEVTPTQLNQIKTAQAVQKQLPNVEAIVNRDCQVLPITKLTQTTAPAQVLKASAVQRSFMPVDLPFQTVKSSSPRLRLKNTPFSFSTDIDMIQPPVDAGNKNYYGR